MKKKINLKIEIEYEDEYCWKDCNFLNSGHAYCMLLLEYLKWKGVESKYKRCQKCIEATENS